jgi:hypothetical protein
MAGGSVLVSAAADGEHAATDRGRVHLPAGLRHAVGLGAGERVLLAAWPGDHVLAVHPPSALDALIPRPAVGAQTATVAA